MFYEELKKTVRHFKETEGGRSQMCKAMKERIDKERIEVLFEAVKSLMKNMKISAEQAMEAMNVSAEDREILIKKF